MVALRAAGSLRYRIRFPKNAHSRVNAIFYPDVKPRFLIPSFANEEMEL